eukprot:g2891.t1
MIFIPLYLTAYSGVPGGDSGELIAESCSLGNAHPPGYPLFIQANYVFYHFVHTMQHYLHNIFAVFSSVPSQGMENVTNAMENGVLRPAYLANVLCCIWTALTGVNIFEVGFMIVVSVHESNSNTKDTVTPKMLACCVAALPAFEFCLSELVWQYSNEAEVFALNNFLCSCFILAMYKLYASRYAFEKTKHFWLCFGALSIGLAISNQHTSVLFSFPMTFVALSRYFNTSKLPLQTKFRNIVIAIGFGLLGLTPYAFAIGKSVLYGPSKGSWGDISTFGGFSKHFLRREYGTFQLAPTNGGAITNTVLQETMSQKIFSFFSEISRYQMSTHVSFFMSLFGSVFNFINILNVNYGRVFGVRDDIYECGIYALLLPWLIYMLVFHYLSNINVGYDRTAIAFHVHKRFWMQPLLPMTLWVSYVFSYFSASPVYDKLNIHDNWKFKRDEIADGRTAHIELEELRSISNEERPLDTPSRAQQQGESEQTRKTDSTERFPRRKMKTQEQDHTNLGQQQQQSEARNQDSLFRVSKKKKKKNKRRSSGKNKQDKNRRSNVDIDDDDDDFDELFAADEFARPYQSGQRHHSGRERHYDGLRSRGRITFNGKRRRRGRRKSTDFIDSVEHFVEGVNAKAICMVFSFCLVVSAYFIHLNTHRGMLLDSLYSSYRRLFLDQSENFDYKGTTPPGYIVNAYGENLLASLPKNAILLSYTDINLNTGMYIVNDFQFM